MITDLTTSALTFRGREVAPNQGMWEVFTVDGNTKLGTIMWMPDWGRYVFSCTAVFTVDADPLADLVEFLRNRTEERT